MTFCALSIDHPVTLEAAKTNQALAGYIEQCRRTGTTQEALEKAEKTGFDLGLRVVHPFIEGKSVPVFAANFVLMGYGTGAIFGCPGHDQRDFDFCKALGLEIIPVVAPSDLEGSALKGLDALLATVQMPGGIPVATFAIGKAGAKNAALFAAAILARSDSAVREKLAKFREAQSAAVPHRPQRD